MITGYNFDYLFIVSGLLAETNEICANAFYDDDLVPSLLPRKILSS